jgi:hypothetical protein
MVTTIKFINKKFICNVVALTLAKYILKGTSNTLKNEDIDQIEVIISPQNRNFVSIAILSAF